MSDEFYGFDDEDFDDDVEFDGDDEDFEFDCGMVRDVNTGELLGCQLAGSEDCDWECPYRADFEREMEREDEEKSEEEAPEAT